MADTITFLSTKIDRLSVGHTHRYAAYIQFCGEWVYADSLTSIKDKIRTRMGCGKRPNGYTYA